MTDSGQLSGPPVALGASVPETASFLIKNPIRNNNGSGPLLRRGQGCLQPTFCRACGACGEDRDACNPRSAGPAVPAVPAATTGMPATHALLGPRCLRRRQGCLQQTFCRACMTSGGPGSRWSRNGFILYMNSNTR